MQAFPIGEHCEDRVLTWGFQRVLKSNSLLMLSVEKLSIFKLACTIYLPGQKLLGVVKSCCWRWGNCNVQASEDSKWWGCQWLQISDLISLSLFFKSIYFWLCWIFDVSSFSEWGLLSNCVAWASHCGGFSCCEAQARGTQPSVDVALGL